jgi:hypothetical protein
MNDINYILALFKSNYAQLTFKVFVIETRKALLNIQDTLFIDVFRLIKGKCYKAQKTIKTRGGLGIKNWKPFKLYI